VSMKLSTRQVDGVTIVDASGRITLGEGSVLMRDTVRDLLAKGNKKIILNLGDVNYIDSSGIGELVSAFTTTKNQGGELKLLNLTKKVHDLLQITKLYTVFDVKDGEAEDSQGSISAGRTSALCRPCQEPFGLLPDVAGSIPHRIWHPERSMSVIAR
jgi:anti-sigma B factor antagonist